MVYIWAWQAPPLPPDRWISSRIAYIEYLTRDKKFDVARKEISQARIVFTDSGGIQEEACILRVPSVTIRKNTERPETLDVGASVLVEYPDDIFDLASKMHSSDRNWKNPFGEGDAAQKIITILKKHVV